MRECRPLGLLIAVVVSVGMADPVGAQQAPRGENVLLPGAALPWNDPGANGVRIVRLYGDPQIAGEPFTYRLRLPDGFAMAPHTHPVAEHMTVMSGRFFVGLGETMDRAAAAAYGPGSYVVVGPNEPAYMWAEGETVVQVHGTGPLTTTMVKGASENEGP